MSLKTANGTAISGFCFGTMQFGGKADAANSRSMYDACRAAGINFFDTAHGYTGGQSETLLGEFARAERDNLFIATKCASSGDCSPQAITRDFEESMGRLGMDYVDMMYMHRWDASVPLEATYEALARMVESGRVRHIGVSNYAAWQVMKALGVAQSLGLTISMLQPMYSLVKRQAEVEILPMAVSEGMAVVPYSPLGGGLLTGKYSAGAGGRLVDDPMYTARYGQDWMHDAARALSDTAAKLGVSPITLAVAWVARNPGVTAPIISASAAGQLQPSLDAMTFAMDAALYADLTALTPTPALATDRSEEGL
ncbi:MAG: aldo/keto reductase [Rhodobacter sp.]|nr:aldo/keto reductase [Rhodobacter sp.]